jgi:hypothetical protein
MVKFAVRSKLAGAVSHVERAFFLSRSDRKAKEVELWP